MAEHTPGPWKADEPRFGSQYVRQNPADWDGHGYQLICTLPQSPKGTHYGEMFRANARLIAAAPDLLKALEKIADQMLTSEMELESSGDFEGAYDIMIGIARQALILVGQVRTP